MISKTSKSSSSSKSTSHSKSSSTSKSSSASKPKATSTANKSHHPQPDSKIHDSAKVSAEAKQGETKNPVNFGSWGDSMIKNPQAKGAEHGEHKAEHGEHESPAEVGAQKSFEAADYTNIAAESAGHALAHPKGAHHGAEAHGEPAKGDHATKPVGEKSAPKASQAKPTQPAQAEAAKTANPEAAKANKPEVTKPTTPEKPPVQVREAHGEMGEMVENMKRNGVNIPEPSEAPKPKLQPTGEMAEYVENVKAAQARETSAYKSANKAPGATAATEAVDAGGSAAKVAKGVAGADSAAEATTKSATQLARLGKNLTKGATVAEGVLGPLGVYYGGKEVAHGFHELKDAKTTDQKVDASAKIGMGVGTTTAGAAGTGTAALSALRGATSFNGGTAALGILGKTSVVAAGGVAIIDGAKDIYHGYNSGDKGEMAKGGLKGLAGSAMLAGVATGQPWLVAGGALTYAGVTVYENRKEIAAFAGNVADKAVQTGTAIKDSVVNGVGAAKDKALELGGNVVNGIGNAWKTATSWF